MSAILPFPPGLDADSALFLDLDGTLLDFADRPEAVALRAETLEALSRLQALLGGALAIVSGRPLAEIDALCPLPGLAAAGLHGVQLRRTDGRLGGDPPAAVPAAARAHAQERLAAIEGGYLEDKGAALALHYRGAPRAAETIAAIADELQRMTGSAFTVQHGNHVVELRPRGRDKGGALAELMAMPPFAGRQPWMLGDDLTDEHAFDEVNARGGVSVVVGPRRPTMARFALRDPPMVRHWLARVAGRLTAH